MPNHYQEPKIIPPVPVDNVRYGVPSDHMGVLVLPVTTAQSRRTRGVKVARNFSYSPATPSYAIRSLPKLVRNYRKTCLIPLAIGFSCKI